MQHAHIILAHSYIRFSTKQQSADNGGDSERRQTDSRVAKFCAKHNLTLSGLTRKDAGLSGFHGTNSKKGELAAFVKAIELGTVKAGEWLVIENIDRLSRMAPLDALELIQQIIKKGVTIGVIDCDMVVNRETLNDGKKAVLDELLAEIKRAHRESLRKSDMIKDVWQERRDNAKAGKPQSGR